MESERQTVLIVEDQPFNRAILRNILGGEYEVDEASNGVEAFDVLARDGKVAAILLDIVMPIMDGYTFLQKLKDSPYASLPVIAVTGEKDEESEQKALNLGAWDFVSKPYQTNVLLLRLKNVIIRSQFYLLTEMQRAYEFDSLTGLYNRTKFFAETQRLLRAHTEVRFCMVHFDIDHFHLLNTFWGEEEGNRFLRFIADEIRAIGDASEPCSYARINADTFCICLPYDAAAIKKHVETVVAHLTDYNRNYLIEPSFGVYIITDPAERIEAMFEHATLAAKECKGKYMTFMCYYKPEMDEKLAQEQVIINQMQQALDQEQFVVYLQPKFNLRTEKPYGAEALIRWQHPTKGLLSPGMFIPIFERNGFIGQIDYYMWEKTCQLLRRWIDQGRQPAPISVNVSRVNMYNPNLISMLVGLVKKYDIDPALLNLELTESAYMDNPEIMGKTVTALHEAGFIVMMDDFGSGYSSLNTLKDIPINVLKIDMKFLSGQTDEARKECIMAAVVHMAGWLDIPVIMEGVETAQQVAFLRSIGCGYVQGYYYARPMPVDDYERLVDGLRQLPAESRSDNHQALVQTIWAGDPQVELLFNSILQPAAIIGFENDSYQTIRVNARYNELFGYGEVVSDVTAQLDRHIAAEDVQQLKTTFRDAAARHGMGHCQYHLVDEDGRHSTIDMRLRYWGANETTKVFFALFEQIKDERQAA